MNKIFGKSLLLVGFIVLTVQLSVDSSNWFM